MLRWDRANESVAKPGGIEKVRADAQVGLSSSTRGKLQGTLPDQGSFRFHRVTKEVEEHQHSKAVPESVS